MKTITVPKKYGYPTLDVTVNGKVYTVKSGEEITIEDHIAEAIENAIALAPKIGVPRNKFAQLAEGDITEITAEDLDGATALVDYVFYNYDRLTKITIPNGVTSIGEGALAYCNGLTSVIMPESMVTIGIRAFIHSINLKKVTLKAMIPPVVQEDSFLGVHSACVFEVPADAVEAYKASPYWSAFANKIVAIEE